MSAITDEYRVSYQGEQIGLYYCFNDGTIEFQTAYKVSEELLPGLKELGLDHDYKAKTSNKVFAGLANQENRVLGKRQKIYKKGDVVLERIPEPTDERFMVYRRDAKKGEAEYSALAHDAPHYEGEKTPEGMKEWCSWYAFNKMDDGTYEAELDEAWWWGGGHNDGGTIHTMIPEEWFELPYKEFLEHVVTLSAAAHYGFTAEQLVKREGLKEFFGFTE